MDDLISVCSKVWTGLAAPGDDARGQGAQGSEIDFEGTLSEAWLDDRGKLKMVFTVVDGIIVTRVLNSSSRSMELLAEFGQRCKVRGVQTLPGMVSVFSMDSIRVVEINAVTHMTSPVECLLAAQQSIRSSSWQRALVFLDQCFRSCELKELERSNSYDVAALKRDVYLERIYCYIQSKLLDHALAQVITVQDLFVAENSLTQRLCFGELCVKTCVRVGEFNYAQRVVESLNLPAPNRHELLAELSSYTEQHQHYLENRADLTFACEYFGGVVLRGRGYVASKSAGRGVILAVCKPTGYSSGQAHDTLPDFLERCVRRPTYRRECMKVIRA